MHIKTLRLAAIILGTTILVSASMAQADGRMAFSGRAGDSGPAMHSDRQIPFVEGDRDGSCRRGHDRGHCGLYRGGYGYGYASDGWARYNNRNWSQDSYNDWWHDRPDRAYPRWVSHNQGCTRQWYMGDTLTC